MSGLVEHLELANGIFAFHPYRRRHLVVVMQWRPFHSHIITFLFVVTYFLDALTTMFILVPTQYEYWLLYNSCFMYHKIHIVLRFNLKVEFNCQNINLSHVNLTSDFLSFSPATNYLNLSRLCSFRFISTNIFLLRSYQFFDEI